MNRRKWSLLLLAALGLAACGTKRSGTNVPGQPVPGPEAVGGLQFEIRAAELPTSGPPTVTFRVTDAQGAPIDLLGAIAAGSIAPRFTLAELEPDFDERGLLVRDVQGRPFQMQADGGTVTEQPALATAPQVVSEPSSGAPFPVERLQSQGDGVYTYTFGGTPAASDRTRTHIVGLYGRRQLDGGTDPASATFDFVPAGGTAQRVETVTDPACNACHGQLQAHDQRVGVQLCRTCHNPSSIDPESGNTVDLKVMTHKIHRGENLPSVEEGQPYFIVGFQNTVHDYSHVAFPQDVRNCTTCHQGAQADLWKTNPSLSACTSCHDNVSFTDAALPLCSAGAGRIPTTPCRHTGPLNIPENSCSACHSPEDIEAFHVNPATQAARGSFQYEILEVTNTAPGQKPSVRFRVFNPSNNTDYDIRSTAATSPFAQLTGGASRLFVDLAWPSQEYTNVGANRTNARTGNAEPGQPVQIDALATATANGDGTFTVTSPTAIPEGVQGSGSVSIEGHPAIPDPAAPATLLRVPVPNVIRYFAITDASNVARREVVSAQRCDTCHFLLTAHGNNRNDNPEVCAVCHNADATDLPNRTSYVAGQEQSIDFKVLIHQVHGSAIVRNPVTITGFGGSQNTFPLPFTNDIGNCALCHVGDSFQLPLESSVHDTTTDSRGNNDPNDNVRTPRAKAVCASCHDNVVFSGEAPVCQGPNDPQPCLHRGGAVGDASDCSICHGAGAFSDVAKVHPVRQPQ